MESNAHAPGSGSPRVIQVTADSSNHGGNEYFTHMHADGQDPPAAAPSAQANGQAAHSATPHCPWDTEDIPPHINTPFDDEPWLSHIGKANSQQLDGVRAPEGASDEGLARRAQREAGKLPTGAGGAVPAANAEPKPEQQQEVKLQIEEDTAPLWSLPHLPHYWRKWRGAEDDPLTVPKIDDLAVSWLGAFLGILAVSGMSQLLFPRIDLVILVPSFGASAVLVFGVIESKMAQPRNFLGGMVLSAFVGVIVRIPLGNYLWLSAPIAVSLALLLMQVTKTTHPPGGATALVASIMKEQEGPAGFSYVLAILIGAVTMQLVALLVNNLHYKRRYPTFWWNKRF